jgi:hypothetical protein
VIGAVFLTLLLQTTLAAQAGRSFRRLCSETILRKGGVTVKGSPRTPSHDAVLIGDASDKQEDRGRGRSHLSCNADTTAHGRYKGMRLNSATR